MSRHRGWDRGTSSSENVESTSGRGALSADNVVPFRARREALEIDVYARRDDDGPSAGGAQTARLLTEEELRAIETAHGEGLTAVQIVDAFTSRNVKFSEASFRKYVQQGLLPRSVRVGRKGKHKGSLGVYPAKTIRRINTVKQLMIEGYTIEEIQGQVLLYTDLVETVEEKLAELWHRLDLDTERFQGADRRQLHDELAAARRESDKLVARLNDIARRIAAPRTDTLRLAGAAGGAEDLL